MMPGLRLTLFGKYRNETFSIAGQIRQKTLITRTIRTTTAVLANIVTINTGYVKRQRKVKPKKEAGQIL